MTDTDLNPPRHYLGRAAAKLQEANSQTPAFRAATIYQAHVYIELAAAVAELDK